MKNIFFIILGITLSMTVLMNEAAAQTPKIRIGEFTGSSGGTTVEEIESGSSKGLTDADVEFMYKAGLFDDEVPFFRQRISLAYSLFEFKENDRYFRYEGGTLAEKYKGTYPSSHGIAIQYHYGASFIRDLDWRGNPLLGLNLLLDGSFGSDIKTLGLGAELHFLWIFKIAAGITYMQSENRIFKSGEAFYSSWGKNKPIKDDKSAMLEFFQFGITIPLSSKFDLFALLSYSEDEDLDINSFRTGVSLKFW
ncbi:MAG: hypothetical protein FWG49_07075 [Leptospirales bacterium]|nr:hypothetical protein [Leptospirales bacterium]